MDRRRGAAKTVEGGSLETIRQMVASGVGVTVLPATSVGTGGALTSTSLSPRATPDLWQACRAIRLIFLTPRPGLIRALRHAMNLRPDLAVFLPLALGLWIWESDWALWLRLVLIGAIAIGNLAAFSGSSRIVGGGESPRSDLDAQPHDVPHDLIGVW